MPIYAYKCDACGFAKDVLQKISDPVLTVCPSCGATAFQKQVTAAGFQLKGSGWYATDFKGGGGTSAPAPATGGADKSESKAESKSDTKPSESASAPSPSAPSASGGGCGSGCACH